MADPKRRLHTNVPGEFFVDDSCINCDTCRQLAPETFADGGDYAYVQAQPATPEQRRAALRALLCCPTGSVGTMGPNEAKEVTADFPLLLEDGVFYCGFNSPKSYGGNSYFVRHPGGNWLIDSPKFLPHLVRAFAGMGGIRYIFLTHQDDVAAQPEAEIVIEGREPVRLHPDFVVIPTPGHTRGHCALLYGDRFLFSGDHLWGEREGTRLHASRELCWYSWTEQKKSMARLLDYSFEWVLCGHGQRVKLPREVMRRELEGLVGRM